MLCPSVHHVAIIGSDYRATRHFYVDLLGLEIIRENRRPAKRDYKLDLRCGDLELEIFAPDPDAHDAVLPPKRVNRPEACGLRHLAFRTDDIEADVAALQRMGIDVEPIRLDEYSQRRFTFFRDPDDLPLELHE